MNDPEERRHISIALAVDAARGKSWSWPETLSNAADIDAFIAGFVKKPQTDSVTTTVAEDK